MKELGLWVSSAQFSGSVVSDSFQPHESQHARPPCPSPGVYSHSCPLSQWCHPAISFSVVPFSSCPQSLPASKSFPMSQIVGRGAFFKSRDMGKIIIITLHNSTSNFFEHLPMHMLCNHFRCITSLLQGIVLIQGSNLGLPHCRQILYHLSHQKNPYLILPT